MDKLNQQELREYLNYNPTTGIFTWLKKTGIKCKINIGSEAGTTNENGYGCITIKGKPIRTNRAAWIYMNGPISPGIIIDHEDRNPANNRIDNLRPVTPCQSSYNTRKRSHNKSGYKGVRRKRNKWQATIVYNKKAISLGVYSTPEEAYAAYCAASIKYHGEYACVG
jgi:hypothetical protein